MNRVFLDARAHKENAENSVRISITQNSIPNSNRLENFTNFTGKKKAHFVDLLRDFARRTARTRGVDDSGAREQLALINGLIRSVIRESFSMAIKKASRSCEVNA